MTAGAPHRPPLREAEQVPDVLGRGDDDPGGGRTPRRRAVVVGLCAAVVITGAVLSQRTPSGGAADPPALVVREDTALLPRVSPGPPGLLHAGLQLDVVNRSNERVVLTDAALVPGGWEVDVLDDADSSVRSDRGRVLRPDWSAVLVVHRPVDCAAPPEDEPVARTLVLDLDRDGGQVRQRIDVRALQTPGAGLLDALARPAGACPGHPGPGPWAPPHLLLRLPGGG